MRSNKERLLKKHDKDMQDFDRKFRIEENNHLRRLQEFEQQYKQQMDEIRRRRRARHLLSPDSHHAPAPYPATQGAMQLHR